MISIRAIDTTNDGELEIVTRRCMLAVLETAPEFEGREDLARKAFANFTYNQMAEMIRNEFDNPNQRIMVALEGDSIVGQAIYSVKRDDQEQPFGFCFSRYVQPSSRRKGIATALLRDAIEWFIAKDARYVVAHTHVSNVALQALFTKFGFRIEGPFEGAFKYFRLRKDL